MSPVSKSEVLCFSTGTVYASLGILDQANELGPQLHAHYDKCLDWLCIQDNLEQNGDSARAELNKPKE